MKKIIKKTAAMAIIALAVIFVLMLLVAPPVAVHLTTNGHVDYGVIEDHPLQKMYTSSDFALTSNDMMLTTEDSYEVWASEVTVENPKAIIIYLSGIRQPSVTYFYGHAKWMKSEGYASFLLEVRGHGKSSGDRVCLGYEEAADVKAVVDYIKQQERYKGVPIVIHGVSMGGAIAINSFGQIDEITGLIAMSAYSSFEDVVVDTMKQYNIPRFICDIEKPLVRLSLQTVFGDKVNDLKPIKQVENIGERPALFIASANDTEVSYENMNRLLKAAPEQCEGWLRESDLAGHFIILNHDIENVDLDTEYCEKVLSFLENKVVH
ncbi:MAG TPA: lysophospholipase [Desulfitobacterium dehalogenans]|uniref:Lysophospholipase n=1 Tax=Desulfitobacterium dehalogenans TaxID=36854 RepID=A0A7C6Z5M7_9FIRM|nr:lysophospholipase [Desulfitobacterium dehalogenans]